MSEIKCAIFWTLNFLSMLNESSLNKCPPAREEGPRIPHKKYIQRIICRGEDQTIFR